MKEENKEIIRVWLTIISFTFFLILIGFAIIYNTLKNQIMDRWYWGLIGLLVVGLCVSIKWFFLGGEEQNDK